jgi:ribosomal protein S18 acetylase RimI-like enzyme
MSEVVIRHYLVSDQPAVFQIAADTAFFGEPVEAFLDDRQLFCDSFVGYYTINEAGFCWVADIDDRVIGFLLGSTHILIQTAQWRRYIFSNVLVKAIFGRYKLGMRTANYAVNMLVGIVRGEEARVDLGEYPAHLHINVLKSNRGEGVGRRLIDAYLKQLRDLEVCGVHLGTTSHNEIACHLYEKMGFQLLKSHPNNYWTKRLGFAVDNRRYGLKMR